MELSSTSLVVRGGVNRDPAALVESLDEAIEDGDGPIVSVFCGEELQDEPVDHAVKRIAEIASLPHSKVQVGRAGPLWDAGILLEWDVSDGQAPNHFNARFHEPVEESQAERFIACFDGPIPNPTGGKKGRTRR